MFYIFIIYLINGLGIREHEVTRRRGPGRNRGPREGTGTRPQISRETTTMKRFWTGVLAAGVALVMGAGVAAADDLAKIKDDGVMKIAMSGAYPPFNFVNDRNEVVGFDAAIGREIAKRIGVEGHAEGSRLRDHLKSRIFQLVLPEIHVLDSSLVSPVPRLCRVVRM